jgi:hypothetical protein
VQTILFALLGLALVAGAIYLLGKQQRKTRAAGPDEPRRRHPEVARRELLKQLRQLGERRFSSASELIVELYGSVLSYLADCGLPRESGETPDEYAHSASPHLGRAGEPLRALTRTFSRTLYGRVEPAPEVVQAFVQAVEQVGAAPLANGSGASRAATADQETTPRKSAPTA